MQSFLKFQISSWKSEKNPHDFLLKALELWLEHRKAEQKISLSLNIEVRMETELASGQAIKATKVILKVFARKPDDETALAIEDVLRQDLASFLSDHLEIGCQPEFGFCD